MTNQEFIESISLPNEEWRDVVGYEGYYIASNIGRVISLLRYVRHPSGGKKIIKPHLMCLKKCKSGYLTVYLSKNGISKDCLVHRIVATAFIPNPNNKPQIDHIDRDKTNNIVENLKWCTGSENMSNPLTIAILKEMNVGRKHPNNHHPTVALKDGKLIYVFNKLTDCKKYGFNNTVVSSICVGRRKTHKGFTFMYLSDYENLINKSKNSLPNPN